MAWYSDEDIAEALDICVGQFGIGVRAMTMNIFFPWLMVVNWDFLLSIHHQLRHQFMDTMQ